MLPSCRMLCLASFVLPCLVLRCLAICHLTWGLPSCTLPIGTPHTLAQQRIWDANQNILQTTRVPFLVGPSNSGKSTVLYPIDDLFGPHRVAHKPALGSSFGLRKIVSGMKRFMFWDDFRPVEFAHEKTVPVSVFLSLFIGQPSEIQVSQSFNDGNPDVIWQRGVAFTGKSEGL